MADWVHCNVCFVQPDRRGKQFFLTNCGHIICNDCLPPEETRMTCKVCKNSCSTISLTSKMKPEVEMFFTDPFELKKKNDQQLLQISDFQRKNRKMISQHLREKLAKYEEVTSQMESMQTIIEKLAKENGLLKNENEYLKNIFASHSESFQTKRFSPSDVLFGAKGKPPPTDSGTSASLKRSFFNQSPSQQLKSGLSEQNSGTPHQIGLGSISLAPLVKLSTRASPSCQRNEFATPGPSRISMRTPPCNGRVGVIPSHFTPTLAPSLSRAAVESSQLNSLVYEIHQLLKAVENKKQLIAVHTKDIEEAEQYSKQDLLTTVQEEENTKLFQKQQLYCSKNIDSLKETCYVIKDQEQVLAKTLECLKVERQKKEDDHQTLISHYNAEIERRKTSYETHPLIIQQLEAEAAVSECQLCLDQLAAELDDLERQKKEQEQRKDEICHLQVFTNPNDFCVSFAETYVALMKKFPEIAKRKAECEMLQKQIDEVKDRKKQEIEQRAQQEARKQAAVARAQTWAEQQRKAENELRSKQRNLSEELIKPQKPRPANILARIERCFTGLSLSNEQSTSSVPPLLAKHRRSPPKITFPTSAIKKSIPSRRICEVNNQLVKLNERLEVPLQRNLSAFTPNKFPTTRSITNYRPTLVPVLFDSATLEPQQSQENSTRESASMCVASTTETALEVTKDSSHLPHSAPSDEHVCFDAGDEVSFNAATDLNSRSTCTLQDTSKLDSSANYLKPTVSQPVVSGISAVSTEEQSNLTIEKSTALHDIGDTVEDADVQPGVQDEPIGIKYELENANQESDLTWISDVVSCQTPQRPLASSSANIIDVNEHSGNINWDQKLAELKELATSPGILLYTGRRMFTNKADPGFQQLNQPAFFQLNDDCAMETEETLGEAISNDEKNVVASTGIVIADSVASALPSEHSVDTALPSEINAFQLNIGKKSVANIPDIGNNDVLENMFDIFSSGNDKKVVDDSRRSNLFSFGDGDKNFFKDMSAENDDACFHFSRGVNSMDGELPKEFELSSNDAGNESSQSSFKFSFGASTSPDVECAPFTLF